MITKNAIDNFRRIHTKKLTTLRDKLGIQANMQQFEAIIKAKQGQREYQAAKEHRDFVEKTENIAKTNRDLEDKIKNINE